MIKYHWSLKKSLEFIKARKPNLEVKSEVLEQLVHYEAFLHKSMIKNPSFGWNEKKYNMKNIHNKLDTDNYIQNEDFMLRNTYLNSLAAEIIEGGKKVKGKKLIVKWMDKGKDIKAQLEDVNGSEDTKSKLYPVTAHIEISSQDLKPSIKSSKNNTKSKI